MTAPRVDRAGRWASPVPADALRQVWSLARREFGDEFPGVSIWFGLATETWWAVVPGPGGWRLVEAVRPQDLRVQIRGALGLWPVYGAQRHGRSGGNPDPYRRAGHGPRNGSRGGSTSHTHQHPTAL